MTHLPVGPFSKTFLSHVTVWRTRLSSIEIGNILNPWCLVFFCKNLLNHDSLLHLCMYNDQEAGDYGFNCSCSNSAITRDYSFKCSSSTHTTIRVLGRGSSFVIAWKQAEKNAPWTITIIHLMTILDTRTHELNKWSASASSQELLGKAKKSKQPKTYCRI